MTPLLGVICYSSPESGGRLATGPVVKHIADISLVVITASYLQALILQIRQSASSDLDAPVHALAGLSPLPFYRISINICNVVLY